MQSASFMPFKKHTNVVLQNVQEAVNTSGCKGQGELQNKDIGAEAQ